MKTKNIIFLIIFIVSLTLSTAILYLVLDFNDGMPALALIPHLGILLAMCLYFITFPEEVYPLTMTMADVYEHRRNSCIFKTLYHPFIFLGARKYLDRNEWAKAEVLLDCLKANYDLKLNSEEFDEHNLSSVDFDKYNKQLEIGKHIARLEKKISSGFDYENLEKRVNNLKNYLFELFDNLERKKNRKKYRDEIIAEIKDVKLSLLNYKVLLAAEKKRKTETYRRIVLINLSKSLK